MKNVVITGCSRGLGLALLKTFAKNKYNIFACIRNKSEAFADVFNKIAIEENVKIFPVYMELSNKGQIIKGMEEIIAHGIEIDVLINNAAISIIKPHLLTDYEEVEETFSVNYFAPFLITRHISNLMIYQNKGSIINISSIGSLGRRPGGVCYDASKAALNQFTVSIAQELASFNVRVNALAPGPMQTEMYLNMKDDVKKKLLNSIALKRLANVEEVARIALFLASDEASYITGQIIRVDGGSMF